MGERENAIRKSGMNNTDNIDYDEMEKELEKELEDSLTELKLLKEDKAKIGNPEALGNTVANVVWDQFIMQVGAVAGEDFIKENRGLTLDLRNEAHIQTTENFEKGKIALHNNKIDNQGRYDAWQENYERDENGKIRTHTDRTGKEVPTLKKGVRDRFDKERPKGSAEKGTDMDHTVPAAELIRDPGVNAHLSKEDQEAFANSSKNLNEMDSSLNRSKGDLSTTDWLDTPNANGQKPSEIFGLPPEQEQALREKDREAREELDRIKKEGEKRSIETGKQSQREEAFRIGGKALRAAVMGMLAELTRTIIKKLVAWLKEEKKNLNTFLNQVKEAIADFVKNLKENLITAGKTVTSTVLNAIVGPVMRTVQKIWELIKQGGKSVKDAIDYLNAPENQRKSFAVRMLEAGKIVVAGLSGMGALVLGEVIEKGLMTVPVFAVEIPLLGSLASIFGIFFGAIVAGIAGALVLNWIDQVIGNRVKLENTKQQIEKGNDAIVVQQNLLDLTQKKLAGEKMVVKNTIEKHHEVMHEFIKGTEDNKMPYKGDNDSEAWSNEMNFILDQM